MFTKVNLRKFKFLKIFGLSCLILWTLGTSLSESVSVTILVVLLVGAGVSIADRLTDTSLSGFYRLSVGTVLGSCMAVFLQQFVLLIGLGNWGWTLLPLLGLTVSRLSRRSDSVPTSRFDDEHLDYSTIAALVGIALADANLGFLMLCIPAMIQQVRPSVSRQWLAILLLTSCGLVRLLVGDIWYLATDDRVFDSAYSTFVHNFGYWSWFGASDTWIPYHWLGHGVAGLFSSVTLLQGLESAGILIPLLSTCISVSALVSIGKACSVARSRIPLFVGSVLILAATISGNSVSTNWGTAIALCLLSIVLMASSNLVKSNLRLGVLVFLLSFSLVSSKVSTAVVFAPAIIAGVAIWGRRSLTSNTRFAISIGCVSGMSAGLVLSLGLFIRPDTSSSSRVVPAFGGYLVQDSEWMDSSLFRICLLVVMMGFGLLFPILLLTALRIQDMGVNLMLHAVSVGIAVGFGMRYLTVGFSTQLYVDSAQLLIALAVVLGVFSTISDISVFKLGHVTPLVVGVVVAMASVFAGQSAGSTQIDRALRLSGNGVLLSFICMFVLGLLRVRGRTLRSASQSALFILCGSLLGLGCIRSWVSSDWRFSRDSDLPPEEFFRGSAGEQSAAAWLRENSRSEDVIATNRLCELWLSCPLDGQTPVASLTSRRTWIEAERFVTGRSVDQQLFGETSVRGHPAWVNMRRTRSLEFASVPSSESADALAKGGVRFIWIDKAFPAAREWEPFAVIRFDNSKVTVLELRSPSRYREIEK